MRNLFVFIAKHHFFLIFLLLEAFSITLIVQNNEPQKTRFITSSNEVFAKVFSVNQAIGQYFNLGTINDQLAEENALLHKNQYYSKIDKSTVAKFVTDTVTDEQYEYIVAKVINNSTNRTQNFLTLNKGWKQGIQANMAVICPQGIVGIVTQVSQNFSTVMSVLHSQYRVSAKFKRNDFFGSIIWNGKNYRIGTLTEIPFHVKFKLGDTLLTNSYSNIYPSDIMVGTIKSFNKTDNDNFYAIDVELATDFKQLLYVYVVRNIYKLERETLEKNSQ